MTHLTDEQLTQVRTWAQEMLSIGEIQTKINTTFNVHFTYMEVRLLLDDLSIVLEQEPTPCEKSNLDQEQEGELVGEGTQGFSFTVDPVTRPGALINGHVVFSDGQTADWHLDHFGRLALKPQQSGYRPPQEDVTRFQQELQQHLAQVSPPLGL